MLFEFKKKNEKKKKTLLPYYVIKILIIFKHIIEK